MEGDFISLLRTSQPALQAWGRFVVDHVSDMLCAEVGLERFKTFFKVPPSSRTKDEESARKKLAKKKYAQPFEQMTDLVGARFVVLLRSDLELLENCILAYTGWSVSRERHFEHEVAADPDVFDYQSIHLLVRSNVDEFRGGVDIPRGTVCEVQIRTLLQHAYAELCHDRIYKTEDAIPVSAKRLVARCMALMETTDLMFCEAAKEIEQVGSDRGNWVQYLSGQHFEVTKRPPAAGDVLCLEVVDKYWHLLSGVKMPEVARNIEIPLIRERIRNRPGALFASPAVVLCYWLVANHHTEVVRTWPNEALRGDFELVCADMGRGAN